MFSLDPKQYENVEWGVTGLYLGVCSVVLDDTLYHGPVFKDMSGEIWFLQSGAQHGSIYSFLRFIRLTRQPDPVDVPPLLRFDRRNKK
jgi:hypothetical protein